VKLRAHWLADMQVRLTRRSHFLRVVLVLLLLAAFPLLFGDHGLAGSALAAVIFYNPTARSVCALLGYFPAGLYTSIQDACDAAGVVSAAGAGGGRVILSPGLWLISATLLLPNGVMLWGSSPSSVKLQAAPGFVGTTVVRNKVTDGTQEYAWVDGIQVYADDRAASCIVFDKLFVNSGIRNVVAQHATGSGIVYKSSGSLGGPLYIEDTWSLHHGGDCFLIDDLMENVWLRGITAEYPGNGFAGLRIKGANTSGVILDGIHLENYDTLTTCLGIVVDGSQSVDLRGIESIGYGAGAWSDIVKIQNTVSGSPLGIRDEPDADCADTAGSSPSPIRPLRERSPLPAANGRPRRLDGRRQGRVGRCGGTNNITVAQRAGADDIEGVATKVINTNYGGVLRLYSGGGARSGSLPNDRSPHSALPRRPAPDARPRARDDAPRPPAGAATRLRHHAPAAAPGGAERQPRAAHRPASAAPPRPPPS
jgi:hypothetical protein